MDSDDAMFDSANSVDAVCDDGSVASAEDEVDDSVRLAWLRCTAAS